MDAMDETDGHSAPHPAPRDWAKKKPLVPAPLVAPVGRVFLPAILLLLLVLLLAPRSRD